MAHQKSHARMSSIPEQPHWTTQHILPTYEWKEATEVLEYCGNQAVHISLGRRRARKPGSKVEPELYVCKWYRTAGVRLDSLGGPKYIRREYDVLSSLRHENIVRYIDFGYDPTGPRLASLYLEYCSGGDLRQYEDPKGERLSTPQIVQVFYQVAQALLYLHHGIYKFNDRLSLARRSATHTSNWTAILHRDIKPSNIFIFQRSVDGIHVKLGDFGIAKLEIDGTDTYVGSPDYIAPEQHRCNSQRRTTYKSDIWALGETIRRLHDDAPKWTTLLASRLNKLVTRCLLEDDTSRPNSANIIEQFDIWGHGDGGEYVSMMQKAITRIINVNGEAFSNKRKQKLKGELNLCDRLLQTGLRPRNATIRKVLNFIADRLIDPGRVDWKVQLMSNLVSLMRKFDNAAVDRCEIELNAQRKYVLEKQLQIEEQVRVQGQLRREDQLRIEQARSKIWQQYLVQAAQSEFRGPSEHLETPPSQPHNVSEQYAFAGDDLLAFNRASYAGVEHQHAPELQSSKSEMQLRHDPPDKRAIYTNDNILQQTSRDFKSFAEMEKQRIQEARRLSSCASKDAELNDLKRFAETFALKSTAPDDIIPLLSKSGPENVRNQNQRTNSNTSGWMIGLRQRSNSSLK